MAYLGRTVELSMYYGAKEDLILKARELRLNMTEAEKTLWARLRRQQISGFKFRNQHPIDIYIADFYCHERKLVIEVDGSIHDIPEISEKDKNKTAELERHGIKVLRFTNYDIFTHIDDVIDSIRYHLINS